MKQPWRQPILTWVLIGSRHRTSRARRRRGVRRPGRRPDQDRLRHGPHRRALRQRQARAAGHPDLEGRRQQEGRPPRPAGGAGLLRRPDQPGHRARHLHEAARRRQGRSRHLRLRDQPHRAAHAHGDRAQADHHGDVRARQQREVPVPELLPDPARRPRSRRPAPRIGFFELAAKQNPKPQTVALVGADAEYPQNAHGRRARAGQEVRLQDRLRQELPAEHDGLHADRAGDQGHQRRHRVRGLVPAGLGGDAAGRAGGRAPAQDLRGRHGRAAVHHHHAEHGPGPERHRELRLLGAGAAAARDARRQGVPEGVPGARREGGGRSARLLPAALLVRAGAGPRPGHRGHQGPRPAEDRRPHPRHRVQHHRRQGASSARTANGPRAAP